MTKSEAKAWIKSFSGLRFIIVLMLIFHHFDVFNDLNILGWEKIMLIFTEGYLSVNFFFVLSGFVIQYSYGDKLQNGYIRGIDFLFYRVAHLWPTHVLLLFVALIVYTGKYAMQFILQAPFFCNFFLIQSWIPDNNFAFSYNGLSWAVSTELFFYIAFIFLAVLPKNYVRGLLYGLWTIILLNVIILGTQSPIAEWLFYINPIFRLGEFLLGIRLCDLYKEAVLKPKNTGKATLLEGIGIAVLICAIGYAICGDIGWEWRWQVYYTLPVSILIYVFSFDKGIFSKILGNKIFNYLGKISFPLYMVHQICLVLVKNNCRPLLTDCKAILCAGFFAMFISIIMAILIERFFATPINKWLRNQWNNHRKAVLDK